MQYFKIRWLCPECGTFHQLTLRAWTFRHAIAIFTEYWAETNELLGTRVQLPLMALKIVEGPDDSEE